MKPRLVGGGSGLKHDGEMIQHRMQHNLTRRHWLIGLSTVEIFSACGDLGQELADLFSPEA